MKKKLSREQQEALDCMIRHIEIFRKQSIAKAEAFFAEPCKKCEKIDVCHCNWMSRMNPLVKQSNMKINMVTEEPLEVQDNGETHLRLDMDTQNGEDN